MTSWFLKKKKKFESDICPLKWTGKSLKKRTVKSLRGHFFFNWISISTQSTVIWLKTNEWIKNSYIFFHFNFKNFSLEIKKKKTKKLPRRMVDENHFFFYFFFKLFFIHFTSLFFYIFIKLLFNQKSQFFTSLLKKFWITNVFSTQIKKKNRTREKNSTKKKIKNKNHTNFLIQTKTN